METNRIIELLEIEHECMLKGSHGDCDRKCEDCELVQDDWELHEMYTDAIALLKEQPEIVLCKDCKHYKDETGMCDFCHTHGNAETWYCADGERR